MTSILDSLSILETLTQQEKEYLAIFCQERYLAKWETLFSEWDDWNAMYFLKTWKIDIFHNINWNNEKIWQVIAEEILWEMALFQDQNKRRMWTAKAFENSSLVVLSDFSIKELKSKHPDVVEKIKEIIEYRNSLNSKFNIQI